MPETPELHSLQWHWPFQKLVLRKRICHKMHLRRLSSLLCSCMKTNKQCSDNSECSKAKAVLPTMQNHQHIYLHSAPRLPSPSAWGWTKDNHGNHYGHLRQAEDSYYEPMHCGCKQDCKTRCKCAAANFPCTALLYFEEISMQTSLMTAFESSSRFCVSCCNVFLFRL